MPKLAITAAGTDIGKTYVSCLLLEYLHAKKCQLQPLKPLVSGWVDSESDTERLLHAAHIPVNAETISQCSPWRFKAPLAPHMAAEKENQPLEWQDIEHYAWNTAYGEPYFTLLEGVGGIMAPITSDHHMLQWLETLHWPLIIVGGTYLGAMSHLLTAICAAQQAQLPILGCVINQSPPDSCIGLEDTINHLQPFTDLPLWPISYGAQVDTATPTLSSIMQRMQHYGR